MPAVTPLQLWPRLIERILARGWPGRVHLALESGDAVLRGGLPVHDSPRFSLCLAGTGRYTVLRRQRLEVIHLRRGEAIVAAPGALMEPHPDARYLAAGWVFTPELTRHLLARKTPGRHRFLHLHHSPAPLDEDGRRFFQALEHRHERPPEDRQARRLVELLLLKAAEMLTLPETAGPARRARFTWQAACQFLEEHLHEPVGRQEAARFLQVHPNHLSRLCREFSGLSFHDHLLQARLRRARQLLHDPRLNIAQVAQACGFREANYFIRCCRQVWGTTPGRVRATLPPPAGQD